jgi:hypothetical protein
MAFLLDPAHGWDMTDYPQWPFGVSQISRGDRALRELFGVAYYPGLVVEGEPASGDRQAFVSGVFGNIFDVLVASEPVPGPKSQVSSSIQIAGVPPAMSAHRKNNQPQNKDLRPLDAYQAVVVGGEINWTKDWIEKLTSYVRNGGTVVLNAAQARGLPEQLLGVHLTNASAEAEAAKCTREPDQDLSGQMFRYEKVELQGATSLIAAANGETLVTVNKVGKGSVVFNALPDLLGIDGRVTPFAAHMLAHVFSGVSPVRVSGDVEYLINRNSNGWVVTLFNNNGVNKPQQGMATVDRNAVVMATISLTGQRIRSASDWIGDRALETNSDSVSIKLAPGGIAVVELK